MNGLEIRLQSSEGPLPMAVTRFPNSPGSLVCLAAF